MKRFPAGIFFLLFIMESLIAGGASVAYFLYTGKSQIDEMESYTKSYSISLADAFSSVAEIGYRTKKISILRSLFKEKIEENIIDEAFFVLKKGKIIAHSNRERAKNLKGNIASDEFSYNLDLILKPVFQKSREVLFTDYNVIDVPVSFERNERTLLKRYLYSKIDTTGWLVSKAVFIKKKPVGTVGFIIGKEKIYTFIKDHIEHCIQIFIASLCVSFILSLVVSLVVLIRYRGIQKKAMRYREAGISPPESGKAYAPAGAHGYVYDMTMEDDGEQISESAGNEEPAAGSASYQRNEDSPLDLNRRIKDAIEVMEQE